MGQIIDGAFYSDYDGQEIDRRLTIAGSVSNPNLLDNPWFTVNQRGWTSGASVINAYCADRWRMNSGGGSGTVVVSSSGISITSASGAGAYLAIEQYFENTTQLIGKVVTASVMMSDGTIYKGTGIVPSSGSINLISETNFRGNIFANRFQFYAENNVQVNIRAVKLEVGSVSTLANDVAPNYDIELHKCKAYFRRIKGKIYRTIATGLTVSSTDIEFPLIMSPEMVSKPTITVAGTWVINLGTGSYSVTSIVISSVSDGQVVDLDAKSTGMTAGTVGLLQCASNDCYIDLSADL